MRITKILIALSLLPPWFLLSPPLPSSRAAAAEPLPNILWISIEDTGPELGPYGDKLARTPNLDRFAAEGAVFLNAFSHAP
ncbi:MAG: sulfatase-like hydrolase/transferase, partial [Planctomycetota bacterium]|nr:sulfatase-like hydrolase/transferase [Planctomycetota bacterium]MCZ6811695.1 sulfatase-like hydrolase/transferase [Planctomycetota bacterium]